MKVPLSASLVVALVGCAAQQPQPPTALLQGLVGQTCEYRSGLNDVQYTIRDQGGKWAVHDVFGPPGAKLRDAGWMPATVDGSTVSFAGVTVSKIVLTATGPHTEDAFIQSGVYSNTYHYTCSPSKRI